MSWNSVVGMVTRLRTWGTEFCPWKG